MQREIKPSEELMKRTNDLIIYKIIRPTVVRDRNSVKNAKYNIDKELYMHSIASRCVDKMETLKMFQYISKEIIDCRFKCKRGIPSCMWGAVRKVIKITAVSKYVPTLTYTFYIDPWRDELDFFNYDNKIKSFVVSTDMLHDDYIETSEMWQYGKFMGALNNIISFKHYYPSLGCCGGMRAETIGICDMLRMKIKAPICDHYTFKNKPWLKDRVG